MLLLLVEPLLWKLFQLFTFTFLMITSSLVLGGIYENYDWTLSTLGSEDFNIDQTSSQLIVRAVLND